jgi:hypothetical protein
MPLFVGFPTNEAGLELVPQLASVALAAAILGMLEDHLDLEEQWRRGQVRK